MSGTTLLINGQNIGADVSVSIQDSLGRQYQATSLGLLLDVDADITEKAVETQTIVGNGVTVNEVIPGNVKVKLGFARFNGNLSGLVIDYRTKFFAGTRLTYTIQCIVRNPDGSIDTYLFVQCKPMNANFGGFKPEGHVAQTLHFLCQDLQSTTSGGTNALFAPSSGQ